MDDFNPYAAPQAPVSAVPIPSSGEFEDVRGVWQDGKTLVMAKVAELPNRCVKCNAPATFLLKRSLSWHHQAIYLVVLLNVLLYIIVALIVRKTAKIYVPLCDEHRGRRSRNIMIAWIVGLAGLALCFAPALDENLVVLVLVGIIMILFALIFGQNVAHVVRPQKIDETHIWLNKVSPVYLATLPPLPTLGSYSRKDKLVADEL